MKVVLDMTLTILLFGVLFHLLKWLFDFILFIEGKISRYNLDRNNKREQG